MRKCISNLNHYVLFEIGLTEEGCKGVIRTSLMKQGKVTGRPPPHSTVFQKIP